MCPIVTLPNGQVRDEIRQPLYDSYEQGAAVSPVGTVTFFSSITGKNLAQTNMTQAGSLPTATSFRTQGMAFDAQNFNLGNVGVLPVVLQRSSLEFDVGTKTYWQGATRYACGRIQSDLGGDAANIFQQYGWAAIQPIVWQGRHVVDINPVQNFNVTFVVANLLAAELTAATPAAGTSVIYVMSLKGLLRRSVQ